MTRRLRLRRTRRRRHAPAVFVCRAVFAAVLLSSAVVVRFVSGSAQITAGRQHTYVAATVTFAAVVCGGCAVAEAVHQVRALRRRSAGGAREGAED